VVKVIAEVVKNFPFWSGFATGTASGSGGTVIAQKVIKLLKYKYSKKKKSFW